MLNNSKLVIWLSRLFLKNMSTSCGGCTSQYSTAPSLICNARTFTKHRANMQSQPEQNCRRSWRRAASVTEHVHWWTLLCSPLAFLTTENKVADMCIPHRHSVLNAYQMPRSNTSSHHFKHNFKEGVSCGRLHLICLDTRKIN